MRGLMCGAIALSALSGVALADVMVTVPGTSNLWLAGMPDGSTAGDGFDTAPAQSPTLVPLAVSAGTVFSFVVTGSVNNDPSPSDLTPDGIGLQGRIPGAENGIANLIAPTNSLIGVFLDATQPDGSEPPATLDFSVLGLDVAALFPGLKQPFFIGDGLTSAAAVQTFTAPRVRPGSTWAPWTASSGSTTSASSRSRSSPRPARRACWPPPV